MGLARVDRSRNQGEANQVGVVEQRFDGLLSPPPVQRVHEVEAEGSARQALGPRFVQGGVDVDILRVPFIVTGNIPLTS